MIGIDDQDVISWIVPAKDLADDSEMYVRAQATIRLFKLNEGMLPSKRTKVIGDAMESLEAFYDSGDVRWGERVRTMASRFHPYGISIRQLLMVKPKASKLIPSPAEELLIFLQDLLSELARTDKILAKLPTSKPTKNLQELILWALAVLWKFPPHDNPPELVELLLADHNCLDRVAEYYARI